jgi:DNA-binding transcriptional regulator YhcF (GntR family)
MAQQATVREAEQNPFSTDPNDELPVGIQLAWRLRALIATGRLGAGEQLPSFRRLAGWAGVNVNTVRAVYAGLESEGLVVSRQGQGTFVAEGIEAAPQLEQIAGDAVRRAREAGLSLRDLAVVATACASIPEALDEVEPVAAPGALPDLEEESEALEVRHELRRQIGRLEAELAAYVRDLPGGLPTAPLRAEAHVAGVEELEQTRDTLIAKLSEAQKAAELRAREEGRERVRRRDRLAASEDGGDARPSEGPLERAMSWWRHRP